MQILYIISTVKEQSSILDITKNVALNFNNIIIM